MTSKWKYKPLIQDAKEEEETVLIDSYQFSNQFSNQFRPTNQRNPFNNLDNIGNKELLKSKDDYELKLRNGGNSSNNLTPKEDSVELIEYCIKPNDSLLSISISCNCSVEELKRVNKLINDQEFYGLRYIKIPVRKYGLLSEVLIHQLNQTNKPISIKEIKDTLINSDSINSTNQSYPSNLSHNSSANLLNLDNQQPLINFNDHTEPNSSTNHQSSDLNQATSSKSSSTNSLIVNVGLKKTFDFDRSTGDLNKFLESLDSDLEKMRNKLNNKRSSIIDPLSNEDLYILGSSEHERNECDGAQCGLTWKSVFFIAILVCIIIPIIYFVIYIEEKNLNHHLDHHLNHH